MGGHLAQSRYSGEGIGPASNDVPDFIASPCEALPSLRN